MVLTDAMFLAALAGFIERGESTSIHWQIRMKDAERIREIATLLSGQGNAMAATERHGGVTEEAPERVAPASPPPTPQIQREAK